MPLEVGSKNPSDTLRGDSGVAENNCRGTKTVSVSSQLLSSDSGAATAEATSARRGLASVSEMQRLHSSSWIIAVGCLRPFASRTKSSVDKYFGSLSSRILLKQQCAALSLYKTSLEAGSKISSDTLRGDSGVAENNCRGVKTVGSSPQLPTSDSGAATADATSARRG